MRHGVEGERSAMPDGLLGIYGDAPGFFRIDPGALEVAQLQPGVQAHVEDVGEAAQLTPLAQLCLGPVQEADGAYGISDGVSSLAQEDQGLNVVGARIGL
jgi:hypothetical protein